MTYQETAYQKINLVDANGNIISSFGGSGGGGDASATNQQTEINRLTDIRDRLNSSAPLTVIGNAGNLGLDATLQQIRDAIKAQIDIATNIWTDNSGVFYVQRNLVNEGTGVITVTFTDPLGNAATPGAGLRPLATEDKDTITDFYDVNTSGTGYSVGDLLARVAILDVNSGTPSATFIWLNLTAGTILSSIPASANIERANESINARQVGIWSVAVTNLPATQPVSGSVSVANFPATQPVSGTVAISNTQLEITNDVGNPIPVSGSVSVTNFPATQPVSGSVSVANFPATQPVSGTVAISNTQLEITNDVGNPIPVNGTVTFSNSTIGVSSIPSLPTGTNSIGSVSVSNLPATQPVSGSVSVANFPATQAVSSLNLTSLDNKTPVLGTAITTGSTPITAASDDLIFTAIRDRIGNTPVAGATMPTGGVGLFGWLSAIYLFLTQRIPTLIGGRIPVDVQSSIVIAIAPTFATLTVTNANTEYSFTFSSVRKYSFKILSGGGIRFNSVTGKVAAPALPYYTLDATAEEVQELGTSTFTGAVYFASSIAGTIILIQYWQ